MDILEMSYCQRKIIVDKLKKEYPKGTRVELVDMNDHYSTIAKGTKGTVGLIDDIGTIFVKWDNGSNLGVAYGKDKIKKVYSNNSIILAFILTMPNVGSWNGKWNAEGRLHAIVINYTKIYGKSKEAKQKAETILNEGSFYYNFGDGWGACISVKRVTASEAANIRKKSAGFGGYDWMVDSILRYGTIDRNSRI